MTSPKICQSPQLNHSPSHPSSRDSAPQLFARSSPRPRLGKLGWSALERPLVAGDIVELEGPAGAGKTELLLEALIQCVLPRGVAGGQESTALYIATDARWPQQRVAERLQQRLDAHSRSDSEPMAPDTLRRCLSRLLVVRCHSAQELLAALAKVHMSCDAGTGAFTMRLNAKGVTAADDDESRGTVDEAPPLRLVVVDTANAFYWQERCRPTLAMPAATGARGAAAAVGVTASPAPDAAPATEEEDTPPHSTPAPVLTPVSLKAPAPMDAVVRLLQRLAADALATVIAAVRGGKEDGVRPQIGKGWAAATTRRISLTPASAPQGAWGACHFVEATKGHAEAGGHGKRGSQPALCIFGTNGVVFS